MSSRRLSGVVVGVVASLLFSALGTSTAGAASDLNPLPAPSPPVASNVTNTTATLTWVGSSETDGSYAVQRLVRGSWRSYATTRSPSLSVTRLTPDTLYSFRVIAYPKPRSPFYSVSEPSEPGVFVTGPHGDTSPPTAPGKPLTFNITTTVAGLAFTPSTDNVGVVRYGVQSLSNGTWSDLATNGNTAPTLTRLTPGTTYTVAAVAYDAKGNVSPRSEPTTFSTLPTAAGLSCKSQVIAFNAGYLLNVTILNLGTVSSNGWTVTFTMPANQSATGIFNATLTRNGESATLTNLVYNGAIPPGYSVSPGFTGSFTGPYVAPSGFAVNGIPCTTA